MNAATRTPTTLISLWLDTIADPESPAWVISLDQMDMDRMRAETTRTLRTYPVDESEDAYDTARADAIRIATERGLQAIETDPALQGSWEYIYRPDED